MVMNRTFSITICIPQASCPGTSEQGKKGDDKRTQDFVLTNKNAAGGSRENNLLCVVINPLPGHLGRGERC